MTNRYRPEVDGLRALAVLPVVLFHAGTALLPGGFVGVDIFFVISGFLITKILVGEAERTGGVSISGFYARRLRRIAPALLVVLLASFGAAHLTLLPEQYLAFARSMIATLGFTSNIWFWSQTGYFAAQAGVEPLLHTWSLAVEEQFYLFVPIVIGLLAKSRRWLIRLLIGATVLSFALSVVGLWHSPSVTFYWLPTRAWELLLGSLLALRLLRPVVRQSAAQIISIVGLVLIVSSLFLLTETTPFPGPAALPACLGAAMLIYSTDGHDTAVRRILSWSPVVGIGLISYSLYLWHWPVMVFSRNYFGPVAPAWATVSLSFGLAVATLFLVEKPTRKDWKIGPLLACIAAASLALVIGAFLVLRSGGAPSRLPARAVELSAASEDRATICGAQTEWCDTAVRPTVAIIGDSHAALLAEAYDAAGLPVRLLSSNACPPGWKFGNMPPRDAKACDRRNTEAIDRVLADPSIRDVVLVANWPSYEPGDIIQHAGGVIVRIHRAGKQATVFYGLPYLNGNLPAGLAKAAWWDSTPPSLSRPSILQLSGATMVDGGSVLCSGTNCPAVLDGRVVLSDGNHVTRAIARTRIRDLVKK